MRNTRSNRGGLTTGILVRLRGSAVKIRVYAYSSRETYATWKPRVVAQLVLIVNLVFHRLYGMGVPLGPSGAGFICFVWQGSAGESESIVDNPLRVTVTRVTRLPGHCMSRPDLVSLGGDVTICGNYV